MFRFKSFLGPVCISLLFVGLYCSSALSATLIVEDGQLMGATDVLVNGVSYDVEFLDDSADYLYNDGVDFTFTFTTETDALAASAVLLAQVFIDDELDGLFDSDPTLTNGGGYTGYIYVYTPYEIDETVSSWMNMAYAFNSKIDHSEPDGTGSKYDVNTSYDTAGMSGQVYAVWSLSKTSSVPVPTTIVLLGSGLLSLAGLRRKKYFNKLRNGF
nr:PEP-CTERM sorting domain-containing protein [uncultured Desulfobacter sp.]